MLSDLHDLSSQGHALGVRILREQRGPRESRLQGGHHAGVSHQAELLQVGAPVHHAAKSLTEPRIESNVEELIALLGLTAIR